MKIFIRKNESKRLIISQLKCLDFSMDFEKVGIF